jgi:hypothetical protein
LIKLAVIATMASIAGYYASHAAFKGLYGSTIHQYGQQYHLTVLHQGRAASALNGVDIGQYNATPMRLDLVRFTPEQGAPALKPHKMLLESDLKKGDSLSVFYKKGIVVPVDQVGGKSYWHGLSIAAGCLAGLLAAICLYLLTCLFGGAPEARPRRAAYS